MSKTILTNKVNNTHNSYHPSSIDERIDVSENEQRRREIRNKNKCGTHHATDALILLMLDE